MAGIKANRQETLRDFEAMCRLADFEIESFQSRIAGAAFGPERELVVLLARGNGKSKLVAALAVHHLATAEQPRVFIAAASRDQASFLFEYAQEIARAALPDAEVLQREIRTGNGYIRVLASNAPKLHGTSPSLFIIDEFHAFRDDSVYIAARTAMQKRPGAKLIVISTAAASPTDPLGKLRERALSQPDVRHRGSVTDARGPSLRMLEWRVPDEVSLDNFTRIKRANPASWLTVAGLREQREALDEISFQRYHCNRWVGTIGSWLPPGAWQDCAGDATIEPGSRVWVGIDIGGSEADSAVVWADEQLHVNAEIFEGEDAILDVASLVPELAERFDVQMVMADPWHAAEMLNELEQRRIPAFKFPQSDPYMFPAYRELHRAIVQGRLTHPDDERLNEHVHNAVAKHSRRGWRLDKADRSAKIDAVVALAMTVDRQAFRPEPVELVGWL
jgi:phage terminase large subunit-like protein